MRRQVTTTITTCNQCPNLVFSNDMGRAYCDNKVDSDGLLKESKDDVLCFEEITTIPEWCPLPVSYKEF